MINNQVSLNFGRNEICIGRVVDKDSNTETMEGVLGFMNREQAKKMFPINRGVTGNWFPTAFGVRTLVGMRVRVSFPLQLDINQ